MTLSFFKKIDRIFTSSFRKHILKATDIKLHMSSVIISKQTGEWRESTNVLRLTSSVLFMLAPPNGQSGSHLLNTGTIPITTRPWGVLCSKSFTGTPARHFGVPDETTTAVPEVDEWLVERHRFNALFHQQLLQAQVRTKSQADKKRSERSFTVGDLVYLKLQPHIQDSMTSHPCHKLAFRFFRPFEVL